MDEIQINKSITEAAKTIFSWCNTRTSNRYDAEDLSQEIYLQLVKSLPNLRNEKALFAFMRTVSDNVYKQWLKKRQRIHSSEMTADELYDTEDTSPSLLEEDSDLYLLRRELALLSEKYRRAMILYYIDNKSCSEIASHLAISESMVKYLLFKGRQTIKEGMNMERKLGELSYHPKKLIPMYSGEGPNRFWDFMKRQIPQNIISACYNDQLTPEQISLETGIPLPYLDDEIKELTDKKLLLKDGKRYSTNIIIISRDCSEEIARQITDCHRKIAEKIQDFVAKHLDVFRGLKFYGSSFSENTLRWQLTTLVLRDIMFGRQDTNCGCAEAPVTGWGERAFLWCKEECAETEKFIFNYSGVDSSDDDIILFFDYLPALKGNHHDFYGNQRYINIFCDIAKQNDKILSEYDLEAVAEMVKRGYVISSDAGFRVATPVYKIEQYNKINEYVTEFVCKELMSVIHSIDLCAEKVIAEHTPKHLKNQISGIARQNKFYHAVCAPAKIMVENGFLDTCYHPLEMPTTFVVLSDE